MKARRVYCEATGEVWEMAIDCAKALGVSPSTIHDAVIFQTPIKGKLLSYGEVRYIYGKRTKKTQTDGND